MSLSENTIVVESIAITSANEAEQIKLTVGDIPGATFHLSLAQARSLAMSLVEQAHRLEVALNMRKAKTEHAERHGEKKAPLVNSPELSQYINSLHTDKGCKLHIALTRAAKALPDAPSFNKPSLA